MYEKETIKVLKRVYEMFGDIQRAYPAQEDFLAEFIKPPSRKVYQPEERCRAITIDGIQCTKRFNINYTVNRVKVCYHHNQSFLKNGKFQYGSMSEDDIAIRMQRLSQTTEEGDDDTTDDQPTKVKTKKAPRKKASSSAALPASSILTSSKTQIAINLDADD
jgi:hypothetical protein